MLAHPKPPVIIDVRTPDEQRIAHLPIAFCVLPENLISFCQEQSDLAGEQVEFGVLCHHGIRSARVTFILLNHGFSAFNIQGGLDAWSLHVDTNIPRY